MHNEPTSPQHVLTILAVHDLTRAVRFYRDAFGWSVKFEEPGFVELAMTEGHSLGLLDRQAFAGTAQQMPLPRPPGALSGTELYLVIEALGDAIERLHAIGARQLDPVRPRAWGDEAAYFADPEGNVVAVARTARPDGELPG